MPNITCFIKRYHPYSSSDASPVLEARRFAKPLTAIIRREGSRMSDNAVIKFTSSGVSIKNGDYVGYLQDDLDTTELVGLWNFTSSCRDESGFDHNATNDYLTGFSSNVTFKTNNLEGRISNRLCCYLNSVQIAFNTVNNDLGQPVMSFASDFTITQSIALTDMNNWGTTNTQFDRNLWYRYNTFPFVEHGIKLFIRHLTNNNWKLGVNVYVSGVTTTYLSGEYTTAQLQDRLLTLALVRQSGTLTLYLDNVAVITQSGITADLTYNSSVTIGDTSTIKEYLYQMRVYNRAFDSDELSEHYKVALPITTLKFYGRVWKIDSGNTTDTVYCNSLAEIILNTKVNDGVLTTTTANRTKNIYNAGLRTNIILTDLLDYANQTNFGIQIKRFMMLTGTTSAGVLQQYNLDDRTTPSLSANAENFYRLKGRFIANGTLLDLFNVISVLDDVTFTFMPTGIITFVKNSSVPTLRRIISTDSGFNLNTGGDDKTMLVNSITSYGAETEFAYTLATKAYQYGGTVTTINPIKAPAEYVNSTTSYSDGDNATANYTGGDVDCAIIPKDVNISIMKPYDKVAFTWGNSGLRLYTVNRDTGEVIQWNLTTAYNMATATYATTLASSWTATSNSKSLVDILIQPLTGTCLWLLDQASKRIHQIPLTTAWEISSAVNNNGTQLATSASIAVGAYPNMIPMCFSAAKNTSGAGTVDGTAWYVMDYDGYLHKWSGTAWNLQYTITLVSSTTTISNTQGTNGMHVANDGTAIYTAIHNNNFYDGSGGQSPAIQRYTLSTPWNLSTISAPTTNFGAGTPVGNRPSDVFWDGVTTLMFLDADKGFIYNVGIAAGGAINATFTVDSTKSRPLISITRSNSTNSQTLDNNMTNFISLPVSYLDDITSVNVDAVGVQTSIPSLTYRIKDTYYGRFVMSYKYIRLIPDAYTGTNKKDSIKQTDTDLLSIVTHGLQARAISIPYLEIGADLTRFNKKFILRNAYSTIPRRITIKTRGLVNELIENNKIKAYYYSKNIGSESGGFPVPEELMIKRIEYQYPESLTTMELGDFVYDSFDLEKITTETVRGIQST